LASLRIDASISPLLKALAEPAVWPAR